MAHLSLYQICLKSEGAMMDVDKLPGQPLADKSAVGGINRPLRYCWQILWWAANLRALFESIGKFDKRWLTKGSSHEGNADGKPKDIASGDVDSRVPGQRGGFELLPIE